MPPSAYPITAQERDAATQRWIVIFVLLSILAHLLLIAVFALLNHFIPTPKFKEPIDQHPATTLSLQQEPAPTPPHKLFMPTDPDALAKPNPNAPVESDNDARLKSMSKEARDASAIMPDVTADKTRTHDLKTRPNKPSPKPDLVAPPPSPQTAAAKQPPTPPQPQPQKANPAQQAPKPTPPLPKPPTPTPPKPTPATPSKTTVDPATGLPVLPPIDAPTLAPQTAVSTASIPNPVSTSLPEEASSSHGALGTHGDNSPEAMATEFGRYKAKVYRAVGARWYPKVNDQFQVMPVGVVHIQFTIHSDGQVDTKVLEGDAANLQILLSISINSIREAAPYDPFTDTLKQEIIKEQGGDGESYIDDFTFSIYGD